MNKEYQFTLLDTLPEVAKDYLSSFNENFTEGFTSEINLAAASWLNELYQHCDQCVVLLIDYGFDKNTYYHSDRKQGTLMCHYQHHAHDDVFFYPGLQDITAHVDFSFIAESALNAGFTVEQFCTQADFLMAHDVLNLSSSDLVEQYQQSQALKRLLLPGEMGELFKVLALSKSYSELLDGFCLRDMRGWL